MVVCHFQVITPFSVRSGGQGTLPPTRQAENSYFCPEAGAFSIPIFIGKTLLVLLYIQYNIPRRVSDAPRRKIKNFCKILLTKEKKRAIL